MSEFREWMRVAGFNAKQVTKAGEAIGVAGWYASDLSRGERPLSVHDRMAMSAHLAGLKPWTAEESDELIAQKQLVETARQFKAINMDGGS